MNNSTVRNQIILGLASVVLIMTALSGFAYFRLLQIKDRAKAVTGDSWPGLYYSTKLDSLWHERHAIVCGYLLSLDSSQKQQLDAKATSSALKLEETLKAYEGTVYQSEDRQLFDAIKRAGMVLNRYSEAVITAGRAGRLEEARRLMIDQMQPAFELLREAIAAEVQFNKLNGDQHNQQILESVASAQVGIPLTLAMGIFLAAASGFVLVRAISTPLAKLVRTTEVMRTGNFSEKLSLDRRDEFGVLADGLNLMATDLTSLIARVQKSGLQVNTSATEIAATAQEQLGTANEIAATTAEIGATAKEISATSKSLVLTMREVSEAAEKTATLANSGQSGLTRMTSTMQQIMEASASITARLAVLSEKAGNISTVVTTITKVADQTNLLSLNAAIEAEKAGNYGRGFAVVATEIRRLADQTALATSDIEQTVKEMQSAVTAGVMGMDKFAEEVRRGVEVVRQVSTELTQIIQQVQTLTPNFETVSEAVESQSIGALQISDSLAQLSEASKQTVDSLRQSNAAIEQLNDAARGLQNGVTKFVLAA